MRAPILLSYADPPASKLPNRVGVKIRVHRAENARLPHLMPNSELASMSKSRSSWPIYVLNTKVSASPQRWLIRPLRS